jgi:hypothetical protein
MKNKELMNYDRFRSSGVKGQLDLTNTPTVNNSFKESVFVKCFNKFNKKVPGRETGDM